MVGRLWYVQLMCLSSATGKPYTFKPKVNQYCVSPMQVGSAVEVTFLAPALHSVLKISQLRSQVPHEEPVGGILLGLLDINTVSG